MKKNYSRRKSIVAGVFSACFICMASYSVAQNKPIRLGVKVGIPNMAGIGLEYVSPLAKNRLGISADASYIPIPINDVEGFYGDFLFTYWEVGPTFYFKKDNKGKGMYVHMGFGQITMDMEGEQKSTMEFDDGVNDPEEVDVEANIKTGTMVFNLMQLRLGWKIGNTFYFRPEIGFNVISIPDKIGFDADFTATDPYTGQEVSESQSFKQSTRLPLGGGPVFTLGFGIAF